MPGKSCKGLLAGVVLAGAALLGGCAAPCGAPGGLCAPTTPNTSAPEDVHPRAAEVAPPAVPLSAPAAALPAQGPVRIALMLPLRSEALGPPAEALRAGFMAAYERDRSGFAVHLIETGDTPQQALEAYAGAVQANDIVVGPLARSAVTLVASSPLVSKPTIALNSPEGRANVPAQMLVMGLSIEDEARQVAAWAAAEHPGAALVLSGGSPWQKRIAQAFISHYKQGGRSAQLVELPATNGYLSEAAIGQLKLRVEAEPPALLFAALDADQLRQVRGMVDADLPVYGTSSSNPGIAPGAAMAELDGLRVLDLPWVLQADHPAVMVYPRRLGAGPLDLDRLYALGIDAYRVAREVALRPGGAAFTLDGVTGRLTIAFTPGAARFERQQPSAVYQGGAYKPVARR
jgi:outer membrane PBP1 activator LpoA protein